MGKRAQRSEPNTPAGRIALDKRLAQLARRRSTELEWYHNVGTVLRELAPKSSKRSIENLAVGIFKNEKFKTTLYACRRFAEVIRPSDVPELQGLNWAIVHHWIYADEKHRPHVLRKLQQTRRSKERRGDRLTPLEARLIVQEIRGKSPVRRAKLSRVPDLGPKSALREVTRLSNDWNRYCGQFVEVAAREANRRARYPRRKADDVEWRNLIDEAKAAVEALARGARSLGRRLQFKAPPSISEEPSVKLSNRKKPKKAETRRAT